MTAPLPGAPRGGVATPRDRCITCGDTATWMRVVQVDERRDLAYCVGVDSLDDTVDTGLLETVDTGLLETVDTGLLETVATGEELLVHAGAALGRRAGRAGGGGAR